MKVRAKATYGKDLSKEALKNLYHPDNNFQLNIGDSYSVYGINIQSQIVHYLTFDKWGNSPFWNPAELFDIVDSRLPPNWYFMFYGNGERDIETVSAVWGYKEIALSRIHYRELILREGKAMDIFRERKKEIDQFHDLE